MQTYRGSRVHWQWSETLSARVLAWCQAEGATLHMALTAAFGVLLWRLNCERDVVVGTAVAGRMRRELEAIVGPFLNLLPLRVRVQPGESFVALVRRIREAALDAYAHQEVPFEKLVEELAPQRALSQHPIFQAMVVAQNTPIEAAEMPGLQNGMAGARGRPCEVRPDAQHRAGGAAHFGRVRVCRRPVP